MSLVLALDFTHRDSTQINPVSQSMVVSLSHLISLDHKNVILIVRFITEKFNINGLQLLALFVVIFLLFAI